MVGLSALILRPFWCDISLLLEQTSLCFDDTKITKDSALHSIQHFVFEVARMTCRKQGVKFKISDTEKETIPSRLLAS